MSLIDHLDELIEFLFDIKLRKEELFILRIQDFTNHLLTSY